MTTESVLSSMQDLLSSSSECPSVTTANVSPANSQTTVQNEPDAAHADSPVNKAILDALQIVTKQQIREVLEPFMQSLGSALEEKNDPAAIEAILNAFKTKISTLTKGEHSKAIATRALKAAKQTEAKRASQSHETAASPRTAVAIHQQRRRSKHDERRETDDSDDDDEDDNNAAEESTSDSDNYDDDDKNAAAGRCDANANKTRNLQRNGNPSKTEHYADLSESEEADFEEYEDGESSGAGRGGVGESDESAEEAEPEPQPQKKPVAMPKPQQQQQKGQMKTKIELIKVAATQRSTAKTPQAPQQQLQKPKSRNSLAPAAPKILADAKKTVQKRQQQKSSTTSSSTGDASRPASRRPVSSQSTQSTHRKGTAGPPTSAAPRTVNSKLYRRRRNPNNSPPPAPAGTPLSSARRNARTPQQLPSDTQLADDEHTSEERLTQSIQKARDDDSSKAAEAYGDCRMALEQSLKSNNNAANDERPCFSGARTHGEGGDTFSFDDFEVPLTNAFDLVECMSGSPHKIATKRSHHTFDLDIPIGDDDEYENDEERMKEVNAFIQKALSDLKQSTIPLYTNINPYEIDTRPTQQQLHEHELRQQRLLQQKEELRVQRLKCQQQNKQLPILSERDSNAKQHLLQMLQQQQQEQLIDQPRSSNRNENYIQCDMTTANYNKNTNNNNANANNGNDIVMEDIPSYDDADLNYYNNNNHNDENVDNGMKVRIATKKSYIDVNGLTAKRDRFLKACSENRFYANPNYAEPWKVFSQISDNLTNEVVAEVEHDFCIGVSKFVEDFMNLEIKPAL